MSGKKDCKHKTVTHSHGTTVMYVNDGCRCPDCREAARVSKSRYDRLKAYGRWDSGYVPAGPVREHVQLLRDYGIGINRVARLAGVSTSTLGKLMYGDPARGQLVRSKVAKHVAERVMALRPRLDYLGGHTIVDASGTRRRLQALIVVGWSQARLADAMGMRGTSLNRVLVGEYEHVQVNTARRVKQVYDELWNQPQTGHDWRSRISANRSRNYAAARGWVSPLAWDDDTIDDPRALPATGGTGYVHAQERLAEVVFLLDGGCSLEVAAKRSGYSSVVSLQQACRRVGRADLLTRITTTLERAAS